MATEEGKYNIKAVSKMLGIQAGTLRAWERRYQMVAPKRNESGHRLYTEEHVRVLRWLQDKVNKGFTISQAVTLLENNEVEEKEGLLLVQTGGDQSSAMADKLLQSLLAFDEKTAHEIINQAFSLFTVDKVMVDILGTLLVKIGDLWENSKITTAHEHFASSILRSRIGMILHSFPHNPMMPKAIAVCGPGEWHELGLLIYTIFLRRKGFEVIYLGASIAEKDIDEVIQIVKPKFIFFSCTMKENVSGTLQLTEKLIKNYNDIHIGLGGFAFDTISEKEKVKFHEHIIGTSRNEWENWLKNRM